MGGGGEADGASNCLSRILFLSCLWLHFYSRITRVAFISGLSGGICMCQKWKSIPNGPRNRGSCRSSNNTYGCCFLMEIILQWLFLSFKVYSCKWFMTNNCLFWSFARFVSFLVCLSVQIMSLSSSSCFSFSASGIKTQGGKEEQRIRKVYED